MTETKALVHVTMENGTVINTTENHPFYVEGKGWCAAADLEDGDVLRTQDGERESVEDVQMENLDEAVKVYNLEIEDSHTYYVSADEVLVHNGCEADITDTINQNSNKDCEELSQLIKKVISERGEHGKIIRLDVINENNFGNIFSDTLKRLIATNGYHYGVEYNGKIYDVTAPLGLPFAEWRDLLFFEGDYIIFRDYF